MKVSWLIVLFFAIILSGCTATNPPTPTTISPSTVEVTPTKTENKVCDWIDKSDIVVKINFTEGITKDTSYEAGFYFSPLYSTMRLARKECDYRTGFNFSEFKGKGVANIGVRNYSDSLRQKIQGEPITINFDKDGKPNLGTYLEVTITN